MVSVSRFCRSLGQFLRRPAAAAGLGLTMLCSTGCMHEQYVPADQLSAAQLRARDLIAQQNQLMQANGMTQQQLAAMQADVQNLSLALSQSEQQLAAANSRVENLLAERTELKSRYAAELQNGDEPLLASSGGAAVSGFEFDPLTGLNRYPENIEFDLGSAVLRAESSAVIDAFAGEATSPSNEGARILVVGHTDDQPISRPSTAAKHETNWHLSTDRADAVAVELIRRGVDPVRVAVMGYSEFQPLDPARDDSTRQRNRRVELYLVPATADLAYWDPASARW